MERQPIRQLRRRERRLQLMSGISPQHRFPIAPAADQPLTVAAKRKGIDGLLVPLKDDSGISLASVPEVIPFEAAPIRPSLRREVRLKGLTSQAVIPLLKGVMR